MDANSLYHSFWSLFFSLAMYGYDFCMSFGLIAFSKIGDLLDPSYTISYWNIFSQEVVTHSFMDIGVFSDILNWIVDKTYISDFTVIEFIIWCTITFAVVIIIWRFVKSFIP